MHLYHEPVQESAIEAAGLVKRYGAQRVLAGLDWSVRPGRVQALLAPPGAGKTLLLRLALGFVAPDEGQLAVLGHPPRHLPGVARRRIGYLPQRPSLRPELAIEAVLAHGRARARDWDAELELELASRFGFADKRRVAQLDPVARRGLELCLALAPHPQLALLDEPCREEGPDGRAAQALQAFAARGIATLVVTSAQGDEVAGLAQDVSIMALGRVLEQAEIRTLLREARELRLPLERYKRVAAAVKAQGIVTARTEGEEKQVVVRRYDDAFGERLRIETEGVAEVRELSLAEIYAATVDVSSTGTGTRA